MDETHRWAGYVEGHSYKEASVLTLGQKTGLFQFSGPGQAQKLLYKNDPQCILGKPDDRQTARRGRHLAGRQVTMVANTSRGEDA